MNKLSSIKRKMGKYAKKFGVKNPKPGDLLTAAKSYKKPSVFTMGALKRPAKKVKRNEEQTESKAERQREAKNPKLESKEYKKKVSKKMDSSNDESEVEEKPDKKVSCKKAKS